MDRLQMDASERRDKLNNNSKTWVNVLPDEDLLDLTYMGAWTLSSCKAEGNGVQQLLNPRIDAFWQSDGPQPHTITIEFPRKTAINYVLLYLDFKVDESYTPSKIYIHTGSSLLDTEKTCGANFSEPKGWELIDIRRKNPKGLRPCRCFVLQIHVVTNHQNGRDTHIRGVKVIGPRVGNNWQDDDDLDETTDEKTTKNKKTPTPVPRKPYKKAFVSDFAGLTIR